MQVIFTGQHSTRFVYHCSDSRTRNLERGCVRHDACVTGHGPNLAIDEERTAALLDHGGDMSSFPYSGEM